MGRISDLGNHVRTQPLRGSAIMVSDNLARYGDVEDEIRTMQYDHSVHPELIIEYLPHYSHNDWGPLAYANDGDSGFDLRYAPQDSDENGGGSHLLDSGARWLLPTGIKVALPKGYELQIRPRSGLAAKHGITVLNAPGTVDEGYRGEIKVCLINYGCEPVWIRPGDRIAQSVLAPVTRARLVGGKVSEATQRGQDGFGSSGSR